MDRRSVRLDGREHQSAAAAGVGTIQLGSNCAASAYIAVVFSRQRGRLCSVSTRRARQGDRQAAQMETPTMTMTVTDDDDDDDEKREKRRRRRREEEAGQAQDVGAPRAQNSEETQHRLILKNEFAPYFIFANCSEAMLCERSSTNSTRVRLRSSRNRFFFFFFCLSSHTCCF
jgi:hypothetical protein